MSTASEDINILAPGQTLARWVIGVVAAGIVAVASFLLEESYRTTQRDLIDHAARIGSMEIQLSAIQEDRKSLRDTLIRMEATDARLEAKLDKIIEGRRR